MLLLTGGGKRIMPNKDITICELLDIGETTTLDNTVNNRTIYLNGSMTRDAGQVSQAEQEPGQKWYSRKFAQTVEPSQQRMLSIT